MHALNRRARLYLENVSSFNKKKKLKKGKRFIKTAHQKKGEPSRWGVSCKSSASYTDTDRSPLPSHRVSAHKRENGH